MFPGKFRVWNPTLKKYSNEFIIVDGDVTTFFGSLLIGPNGEVGYFDYDFFVRLPDAIVEFSTGLKDSSGREIYEGDIVQWGDEIKTVKWDDEVTGFFPFNFIKQESLCWAPFEAGKCLIIGNIHENS